MAAKLPKALNELGFLSVVHAALKTWHQSCSCKSTVYSGHAPGEELRCRLVVLAYWKTCFIDVRYYG